MSECVCNCVCECMCVCVCVLFVFVCVFVCLCVCACVFVCLFLCVCWGVGCARALPFNCVHRGTWGLHCEGGSSTNTPNVGCICKLFAYFLKMCVDFRLKASDLGYIYTKYIISCYKYFPFVCFIMLEFKEFHGFSVYGLQNLSGDCPKFEVF